MEDWKRDRIGSCVRGENPTLIARMKSGFAVMGDSQYLPGYCVLLAYPQAGSLNELSQEDRVQFLLDMTLIGDAVLQACNAERINYSIMMNTDRYLHAHIQARYGWEPEEYRGVPVWFYPKEKLMSPEHDFSEEKHGAVRKGIAECLRGFEVTSAHLPAGRS